MSAMFRAAEPALNVTIPERFWRAFGVTTSAREQMVGKLKDPRRDLLHPDFVNQRKRCSQPNISRVVGCSAGFEAPRAPAELVVLHRRDRRCLKVFAPAARGRLHAQIARQSRAKPGLRFSAHVEEPRPKG